MCLPGLHITLGVFLRLFTLLEDECAKLDLEMAASVSLQPGDRQGYIDYTSLIQKERALLDERSTTEGALKWLTQTLSLLTLNATNPSTDPQVLTVARLILETKKKISNLVSHKTLHTYIII